MIETDVLPMTGRRRDSFAGRTSHGELMVSPRQSSDLKLLGPVCVAIRDLLASRSESKPQVRMQILNRTRQVTVAQDLAIAKTSAQRRRGLLGLDALKRGSGLWIAPCESVHTAGMRFPIDLVYLDRDYRVRKTCHSVRPWRISACLSAQSVIELPAGTNRATGTMPGDELEFCCAVPVG